MFSLPSFERNPRWGAVTRDGCLLVCGWFWVFFSKEPLFNSSTFRFEALKMFVLILGALHCQRAGDCRRAVTQHCGGWRWWQCSLSLKLRGLGRLAGQGASLLVPQSSLLYGEIAPLLWNW